MLLPVVLCDLPCSIFLLFSDFLPFILALVCSHWPSPPSQRGSVSVPFLSPFPSQPHSCSFSFPFLQASLLLPAPSTAFSFPSPCPTPFFHHWRSTTEKIEHEPGGGCYSQEWCACEMPSIVSPALVQTAFIWLGELNPPAQALTQFLMFCAAQSVMTPEEFQPFALHKLKAKSSAVGMRWNVHIISTFFSPPCAALSQLSTSICSCRCLCLGPCNYVFFSSAQSQAIMELQFQLGQKMI